MTFSVGERVRKVSGYGFEGPISGINHKQDGAINYTVELQVGCIADGMQHIFSAGQLEAAGAEPGLHMETVKRCAEWLGTETRGVLHMGLARYIAGEMRRVLLPQTVLPASPEGHDPSQEYPAGKDQQ